MPLHDKKRKAECNFLAPRRNTCQLQLLQNQMRSKTTEVTFFLSAKNNPAHDSQLNVLIKQKDKITTMLKLFTKKWGKRVGHD